MGFALRREEPHEALRACPDGCPLVRAFVVMTWQMNKDKKKMWNKSTGKTLPLQMSFGLSTANVV